MASGTEMVMQSLMRAMGFDPAELVSRTQTFMAGVNERLEDFAAHAKAGNEALARIEAEQAAQREMLSTILELLRHAKEHDLADNGAIGGPAEPRHINGNGVGHALAVNPDPDRARRRARPGDDNGPRE